MHNSNLLLDSHTCISLEVKLSSVKQLFGREILIYEYKILIIYFCIHNYPLSYTKSSVTQYTKYDILFMTMSDIGCIIMFLLNQQVILYFNLQFIRDTLNITIKILNMYGIRKFKMSDML